MTLLAWALLMVVSPLEGDAVTREFVSEGATQRAGGYMPMRAALEEEGENVKKAPEDLVAPRFTQFELQGMSYGVILDEPEGEDAKPRLLVDSNRDGDYTNDPAPEWAPRAMGQYTTYFGTTKVDLGEGREGRINMYRFDPNDPRRAVLKDTVLYYSDFGYEYSFKVGDQTFKSIVTGAPEDTRSLWFDRNGDGRPSRNFEMVQLNKPFNFTGSTYVLTAKDGNFQLGAADEELPMTPLPPDLRLGKEALSFTATTLDGKEVKFPQDYAGKVVMLDFWATWCGPCIGEIPHMKEAYEAHHENGFEILGISFDNAGMEEKLRDFLKDRELPWAQVYEGKGWETTIGGQHDVSAIPFVLLVDGDTGKILGTAQELRGPGLSDYVAEQLAAKKQ